MAAPGRAARIPPAAEAALDQLSLAQQQEKRSAEARDTLDDILKEIHESRPDFALMAPRLQKVHMLAWICRARGFGERGEFSERFLGRGLRGLAAGPYAYEHDAFEPDFTVFDFGDVLDLAQTRHMLQCVAGFAFLPLFVVGFAKVFPAVGIKQHVGLVGEHSPDVACGHALLDIVLLAQWHLSRLNYGVFIIIIV